MAPPHEEADVAETCMESLLQSATRQIVEAALEKIRTRYTKERYHNPEHTGMVSTEILLLAEKLPGEHQLSEKDLAILELAASAHDVSYDHNPRVAGYQGENEKESADWLAQAMRKYPDVFTAQDIALAQNAVMATWARPYPARTESGWDASTTIQQNVGNEGARPDHLIAQLLCDADLSGLGSPWEVYTDTMTGYYLELNPDGGTETTWRAYLEFQNILLKNRQYFTQVAHDRYEPHLLENIRKTTHILNHADSFTTCFEGMKDRAATAPRNPEN